MTQTRRSKPSIKELEQQRVLLQRQRDRDQQALQTLYAISLACRGVTSFQTLFQAIVRELAQVFTFDACYIAVCDTDRSNLFQAVLFEDEGLQEYKEAVERGPLTGLLVQRRGPLLFDDLVAERNRLDETPDTFGQNHKLSRAWLGVPLMLGDDAIGVVSIQSYTPGVFGEAELDLLQQVANVVAVALENVRLAQAQADLGAALSEQVDARTRELVALSTIAGDMVLREPLPRLLNRALGLMLTLLRLDAGNMRLLDRERNSLVLLVHQGFSERYHQQRAVLSLTDSLIRGVVLENRPMVVTTRLGRMAGSDALAGFEALLSVPLRIGSRVLGTLSLFALQPREFDEQERNLAQAVANQAAIAIEIDRLFEERERQIGELRALSAVSHAASTAFDLPSLLRQVHNALQTFMRLDAFSMVIYDPARNIISNGLSIDEGEEYTYWRNEPPPSGSLSAWVIRHRSILQFHNLPEELDNYPELSRHIVGAERHAVSWLGVPLVDRDEVVIGLIALQSYSRAAFSERDVTLLTNIARQVALHVQNVRLLDQRARQIRELDAIGQIGQLISASYDLEEMLEGVYHILNQQLGVVVFYLVICEIETHAITHSVFINQGQRTSPLVPGAPPNPGSLTSWILQHREPLHFLNYPEQQEEARRLGITPSIFVTDNVLRSWLGVPLIARDGAPIGVISLQEYRPYAYDDQTVDLLRQVASHVSLGVQKVRLLDERERQVEENKRLLVAEQAARRTADTLREVARVLSASFDDLDEVLNLILAELNNVIPYDSASLMLRENGRLRVVACQGWPPDQQPSGFRFQPHDINVLQVMDNCLPVIIEDTASNPYWVTTPYSAHVRAWLGVPLVSRGQAFGILSIDSRQLQRFSQRDAEVALAFASQAAVALENARLFQESVTRVEQEMEIAREIQSHLFPQNLPEVPGLELAACCLPARETGGDFYDLISLDEGRLGVVVGDVSGKSLPAAMLMAVARSVARSESRHHDNTSDMLHATNRLIAQDVPPHTFVALTYASFDSVSRLLTVSNAGQLTPLVRRADGSVSHLDAFAAFPLGIVKDVRYREQLVTLDGGDVVIFYTDGIVEAKNSQGELFGFERLETLLTTCGDIEPQQLMDTIIAAVNRFIGPVPRHDDMTLVVLRVV